MQTADFETDAGRAAKVAEKRAKEIDAAFSKAGKAIGVALGAAAVAVGASLKQSIDHMDSMSKAAAKVGQSTEEFSKLVYAGSLADVQMETLVSTMGKLTKAQAAALDSSSQQAKVFDALGISVKNADGSMRSSSDVLLDFADRFKQLGGSQEAIAAGFQVFGRSFQDIIPLIKDGADGLRAAGDEAERLGVVIDSDTAAAAEKFNDDLTRLQSALGGVVMEIASGLLPELTKLSEEMVGAASKGNELGEVGTWLGEQIRFAVSDMKFMVDTLKDISYWATNTKDGLVNLAVAAAQVSTFDYSGAKKSFGLAQQNAENAYAAAVTGRADFSSASGGAPPLQFADTSSSSFSDADVRRAALDGKKWAQSELRRRDAESRAASEKLRSILGGGSGGGSSKPSGGSRKSSGGGLSEEAKFAQELSRSYDSLNASMAERIALFGDVTELQKISYDIEHGSLKGLDAARAEVLKKQAAELDMMKQTQDALQEVIGFMDEAEQIQSDNIAERAERFASVMGDYQEEIQLLGMSRIEQEKFNAAKAAGVELWSQEGQAISEAVEKAAGMRELRDLADGLTASFEDMFSSFLDGSKSASDAWKSFMDDITKQIMRFLVNQAVQQFMKSMTQGQGASGGNSGGGWMALIGAIFGGGRANGGPVSGSRLYEVGEGGKPEIFQQGGKSYLIPGNDGNVIPATSGVSAPQGGLQVVVNNHSNTKVSARQERGKGPSGEDLRRLVINIVDESLNGGQLGASGKARYGWREAV